MMTKSLTDFSGLNFDEGEVILIDKTLGVTSFNVVYKIRKKIKVKKVGHAGTLDPFATGLLIICTGKKTKSITDFQEQNKTYTGVITLGKKTPSMDTETEFIEENSIDDVTLDKIEEVRKSFLGKQLQKPPMYSAVKHKGKALYKYARKGIEVVREPREIEINSFSITKIALPDVHFEINCSKGTYLRVIADDFGDRLGCGAYLSELRRTKIGAYSVDDAFTIEEFVEVIDELPVLN